MLHNHDSIQPIPLTKEAMRAATAKLRERLRRQQLEIKQKKLPVIVLLEGWGAAGKGNLIRRMIRNIDPRFYRVAVMEKAPDEEARRRPFLYRFMKEIPQSGQFVFLNCGWMHQIMHEYLTGKLSEKEYADRIESIKRFERQLCDNGYLVLKLFVHVDEKVQRKRLKGFLSDPNTAWRVSDYDRWQTDHYEKCFEAYDVYLEETHTPNAPWNIIDGNNWKTYEFQALERLTSGIDTALENSRVAVPVLPNTFPLEPRPRLSEIDLSVSLDEETYKKQLKALQKRLDELHNILYRARIPVVVVYEGWDAAGKGGNIRRLTDALDPRGYEVWPIPTPEPHEKNRHYLWRFWTRLPKDGHIAIFDRSWYGRVMVERLEGFCSTNDWQRAFHEMNEFERELVEWGAVVIKFWIHIDSETQLARFTERQNNPDKQWKITDEDWRNREKWDDYERAVDEMIRKTSTVMAPWHIIESNDKRYARIKALRIMVDSIEKAIEEK